MRTKFHTLIPVLTILVAVGGIPHARGEDPNHSSAQESNPLDRLREYREKGELEKMLVYAEEQMRNYPYETEMIQDELVSGYEAHYQLYKLINYFQERLKNDPMAVHPYKVLGQVFQRQEKTARALEMYGKAAVLAPNDGDVQRNLGEIYQGQGAYDKAMVAYKKAIQLQPADTHAYSQVGKRLCTHRQNRRDSPTGRVLEAPSGRGDGLYPPGRCILGGAFR